MCGMGVVTSGKENSQSHLTFVSLGMAFLSEVIRFLFGSDKITFSTDNSRGNIIFSTSFLVFA